jgi:hypothetical protein
MILSAVVCPDLHYFTQFKKQHDKKNLNFLDIFSKNTQISNFMNIGPVGAQMLHEDRHDEANRRFRNFANAPKNS